MPAWLLKLTATLLTGVAAAGAAVYVGGHVKSDTAPLHPPVALTGGGPLAALGIQFAPATGGHLTLKPSVQSSGSADPLTYTSIS